MNLSLLLLLVVTFEFAFTEPILRSVNSFSNRLYSVLPKIDNLIFSPLSLHDSLSTAYQGAAGSTASAIRNALNLTELRSTAGSYRNMLKTLRSSQDVHVEVASRIFIANDIELKKDFRSRLDSFFSDIQKINFAQRVEAINQINGWVKETTHHRINHLLGEEDVKEDSQVYLLSAVYFKGEWLRKFPRARTSEFYVTETEKKECLMMEQAGKVYYGENRELNAEILKIPYKDEKFACVIVLPRKINGLPDLEEKLKEMDLSILTLMTTEQHVRMVLPKFKVETTFPFNNPLKQLGLSEIFSNSANFSKMVENEDLKVDKVIQKAVINFNEDGTEATAANAATVLMKSAEFFRAQFIANHPFIFYVTAQLGHESDPSTLLILFMGKVTTPEYE
ncbi:hypothetical protein Trydic_g18379 [Trypoxylus dichotomus]